MNKQYAEQLYEKYLNSIENIHGSGETNGGQLHKIGKKMFKNKFRGVFPSDEIPVFRSGEYSIINLDSGDQPGSHWVACVKKNKKTYVYDSFGRKTIKIIPSLIQSGNGIIVESENDKEQARKEDNCGQRCLAALQVYNNHGVEALKYI